MRSLRRPQRSPHGGLFVTGTDTAVGKTAVSCALLAIARELDRPLTPFKPAESGCRIGRPEDALALRTAAGRPDLPLALICPFQYRPPVAPAAAAPQGKRLTLPRLLQSARALPADQPLLVESAGGLLSPYSNRITAADLAAALDLPILLVARNALGTINHTALALAEIKRRGLPLLGLILVTTKPDRDLDRQRNPALIEHLTGVRPSTVIPYFPRATLHQVRKHLRESGVAARLLRRADLFRR